MSVVSGKPRHRFGLRARVALAFTVAFTLMTCALGFALFSAFEEMEDTLVERLMNDEVGFIVERLRENPRLSASTNPHLNAYVVRTTADVNSLPAYLRNLSIGQHEIFDKGNQLQVRVRDVNGSRLYVAYDVSLFQIDFSNRIESRRLNATDVINVNTGDTPATYISAVTHDLDFDVKLGRLEQLDPLRALAADRTEVNVRGREVVFGIDADVEVAGLVSVGDEVQPS